MNNRIRFNDVIVTADQLPKIERLVLGLSNMGPSDAFISIDFEQDNEAYKGKVELSSSLMSFKEEATDAELVTLMEKLSALLMIHIERWKESRFIEKKSATES
jgi:hypothetical protein